MYCGLTKSSLDCSIEGLRLHPVLIEDMELAGLLGRATGYGIYNVIEICKWCIFTTRGLF